MGYIDGSAAVTMRTTEDVIEVWINILKGQKVNLWCDGLKSKNPSSGKGTLFEQSNEDEALQENERSHKKRKVEDKEHQSKVDEVFQALKKKHGEAYTQMQFRIWSEMNVGGLRSSLEDPPNTSMFFRAGGSSQSGTKGTADDLTKAVTQIASALKPNVTFSSTSPAKVIENRSKCYKQLSELQNLKESGLLSDTEYYGEREAIMSFLKSLLDYEFHSCYSIF